MNALTHSSLIFNFDDLVLLLGAGQYLLLAGLLLVTRTSGSLSSLLLTAFLLLKVVQALDTLFIWSDPVRHLILQWQPNLLFLGSFSYWLQGPVLYWYVASELYRENRFTRRDLLHLVPALVAGGLLTRYYYVLPDASQVAAMSDLQFMWTTLMTHLRTGWYLSFIAYSAYCLFILARYRQALRHRYANVETRERRWLVGVVCALMVIAVWGLLVHLTGHRLPYETANQLGVAGNYMEFLFVNVLVFTSIRFSHLFGGLDRSDGAGEGSREYTDEQVERVKRLMAEQKPYLEHDINIETLARRLSLPERTLSRVLNHHFGKNFFEFINSYRVDEAKRLLHDPAKSNNTILELMGEAGFTSKSTFNAIFKKHVGKTPSQYRG